METAEQPHLCMYIQPALTPLSHSPHYKTIHHPSPGLLHCQINHNSQLFHSLLGILNYAAVFQTAKPHS
ncbi:hypothetical protein PGT21_022398 [Puccinia graminis f. sp. tritici]|uniref:Uncharacterized protein n=1 Tax=Puccinia graminis f. sp. tritici TaxID=56615 RepID=A0A5B0M789_PUCGR|nr:hypothetical protein PGTUg99_013218 [Puccinia graminis f. sp. tritici]KAA1071898.1 hypothetical protein PGT21_022398 [Puccinia graminis f. sp. tritici]